MALPPSNILASEMRGQCVCPQRLCACATRPIRVGESISITLAPSRRPTMRAAAAFPTGTKRYAPPCVRVPPRIQRPHL
eukprot:2675244-Prorocentrum_lima.AAC.1